MTERNFYNQEDLKAFLGSLKKLTHCPMTLRDEISHQVLCRVGRVGQGTRPKEGLISINGKPSLILEGYPKGTKQRQELEHTLEAATSIFSQWIEAKNTIDDMALNLSRSWRQINAIMDMGVEIQLQRSLPQLCKLLVEKIARTLNAKRISIMLPAPDGNLKIIAARGVPHWIIKDIVLKPGEKIAGHVFKECHPMLIKNVETLPKEMRPLSYNSFRGQETLALLSVPLVADDQGKKMVIGVINVTHPRDHKPFTSEHLKLLTVLASQAALIIRNYQMLEEMRKTERMLQEVELAAQIQRGLLPTKPFSSHGITLLGRCCPSAHIGGDYYDYFSPTPELVNFAIADIAGHGIPAALFMNTVRSAIRTMAHSRNSPEEVASYLNQFLLDEIPERDIYVTGFYGQYDIAKRKLSYVNGGHYPPWRIQASGKIEALPGKNMAFGFVKEAEYEKHRIKLAPGDTIVLFTDGLIEVKNREGKPLGEEGLRKIVSEMHRFTPEKGIEYLYQIISRFHDKTARKDDQTVLVLRVE